MSMQDTQRPYVSPGMPPLNLGRTTSFFEFWPTWLMYVPVVVQWLWLSIKHKSLTLPLIANPSLPVSGMVGVPKSHLMEQASGDLNKTILPYFVHIKTDQSNCIQLRDIEARFVDINTTYPVVCKPDIGCRGAGVKLVKNFAELETAIAAYPIGARILVQKLSQYEPEVGIFYTRHPDSQNGRIISMAFKYMPYVLGDGVSSLKTLIENDTRAGELLHLYEARHQQHWNLVIPKGEPYRLIFSASHSKGAIFKDAETFITPALTERLDALMKQLPEFHYGRLDVKFKSIDSLTKGQDLEIVEINTASSESLHIWDSNTRFSDAVKSLLFQYKTLFSMGAANRLKGHTPPGIFTLLKHWRLERQLTQHYPETD